MLGLQGAEGGRGPYSQLILRVYPPNSGAPALGQELGNHDKPNKALFSGYLRSALLRGSNEHRCRQHKKGQGQRSCYFQKGGQSDEVALA